MSTNDYASNFRDFLDARPAEAPFCFWYGAKEPHRAYEQGSGIRAGKRLEDVDVPPFLPDSEDVRSDLLDYALEIEWFDSHLARMMELLEERGELDDTIIVVTGDNGMPFPKAKANVYEIGMHVPLAVRWGNGAPGGRRVTDLVTFVDLAPTFLEAAGVAATDGTTGRSLVDVLSSGRSGRVDPARSWAVTGRERHAYCRPENVGYPMRALRTDDYLYIRNYEPDRWPAGDPPSWGDIDASPTKNYMIANRDVESVRPLFEQAFGKRPSEELYAISGGYACDRNLAREPGYAAVTRELGERLERVLAGQRDPRVVGGCDAIDRYRYYGNTTDAEGKTAYVGTDALRQVGLIR